MYSENFEKRANFTQENALKVLLRLIVKYIPEENETGHFPWKKAPKILEENPDRIPQVAKIARDIIAPVISEQTEDLDENLKGLVKFKNKFEHMNAFAENASINIPALSNLFEATTNECEAHDDAIAQVQKSLQELKADLRSLDRATNTLTNGDEPKFEQYNALLTIVQLG